MSAENHETVLNLFSNIRDRTYANEGRCVCEGRIVIEKALQNNIELEALLCTEIRLAEYQTLCRSYPAGRSVPIIGKPHAEIEKLAGFDFHRGALAIARRPAILELTVPGTNLPVQGELPPPENHLTAPGSASSVSTQLMETITGNVLVLWQVTDPDNLGTLIRSASALGARAIILGPGSADPYCRKALRTSMGCAFSMPILHVRDASALAFFAEYTDALLTAACPVSADRTTTATCRYNKLLLEPCTQAVPTITETTRPFWLILGNEGWGLPDNLLARVHYKAAIPMHNSTDSLNVAAAGAILLYELFLDRQNRIN